MAFAIMEEEGHLGWRQPLKVRGEHGVWETCGEPQIYHGYLSQEEIAWSSRAKRVLPTKWELLKRASLRTGGSHRAARVGWQGCWALQGLTQTGADWCWCCPERAVTESIHMCFQFFLVYPFLLLCDIPEIKSQLAAFKATLPPSWVWCGLEMASRRGSGHNFS